MEPQTESKLPKFIIAGVAVLVVAFIAWLLVAKPEGFKLPDQITKKDQTDIPEGAVALDKYVFVHESGVYMRAVHGTSSTMIPQADPDTFVAVGEFTKWGNAEILEFCKGAGEYGFYKDRKKVYLFQVWQTDSFAKTKIEVLKDLDPATFEPVGPQLFRDATHSLSVGYEFATTTCKYVVNGL